MPINDVGDAMREMKAGSKHIKSRKQAIAVGLNAKRDKKKGKKRGGKGHIEALRGLALAK
jgi:hypothetical protein